MTAWRTRFHQLLRRQHLAQGSPVRIGRHHIYILPSRYGWIFGLLLLLMLLASLNYDNNPAYLLTFLLFGLGANAMILTWRNLHGLALQLESIQPVFLGEQAHLRLQGNGDRERPGLTFSMHGYAAGIDGAARRQRISLPLQVDRRGRHAVGELIISTRYPLGLFRAWSIIVVGDPLLVYPRPSHSAELPQHQHRAQQGDASVREGADELYGLREFRAGDPLSHADWKGLARGREPMTKQFTDPLQDRPYIIDWQLFAPADTEARLSMMTRLVIDAHRAALCYGLTLPRHDIEPGRGVRHYRACLEALAVFGGEDA